jgi:hypothetical protein
MKGENAYQPHGDAESMPCLRRGTDLRLVRLHEKAGTDQKVAIFTRRAFGASVKLGP